MRTTATALISILTIGCLSAFGYGIRCHKLLADTTVPAQHLCASQS